MTGVPSASRDRLLFLGAGTCDVNDNNGVGETTSIYIIKKE